MSAKYPIIAITGASGSGSKAVIKAMERIFYRERIKATYIDANYPRFNPSQSEHPSGYGCSGRPGLDSVRDTGVGLLSL